MIKDFNLLRLLLVLAETRQTVAAAKAMNVSQPTISVMLRKLREQFNDELFIRNKNGLQPTAKCELLIGQIPALLEQLDGLYSDNETWKIENLSGEIKLFFPSPLMAVIAAPLVNKLTTLAPNVTVECVHWGSNTPAKIESQVNAWGVSYLPMETNKNIYQKNLGYDKFILIMRKEHPLKTNQLSDVISYPICINYIPGHTEPSRVEMLIKKYNLDMNINLRCSDMGMMLKLLSTSNYICVSSAKYTDILPDNYRCVASPPELIKDTFRRQFSLFTQQRNRHDPFTKWLQDEISLIMESNH